MWECLTLPSELLARNFRSQRELNNWRSLTLTLQEALSLTQRVQVSREIHSHLFKVFRSQGLLTSLSGTLYNYFQRTGFWFEEWVAHRTFLHMVSRLPCPAEYLCQMGDPKSKEPNSPSRKKAFRYLTSCPQSPCAIPVVIRTIKCHT